MTRQAKFAPPTSRAGARKTSLKCHATNSGFGLYSARFSLAKCFPSNRSNHSSRPWLPCTSSLITSLPSVEIPIAPAVEHPMMQHAEAEAVGHHVGTASLVPLDMRGLHPEICVRKTNVIAAHGATVLVCPDDEGPELHITSGATAPVASTVGSSTAFRMSAWINSGKCAESRRVCATSPAELSMTSAQRHRR